MSKIEINLELTRASLTYAMDNSNSKLEINLSSNSKSKLKKVIQELAREGRNRNLAYLRR